MINADIRRQKRRRTLKKLKVDIVSAWLGVRQTEVSVSSQPSYYGFQNSAFFAKGCPDF
jgi:hypothetical protein